MTWEGRKVLRELRTRISGVDTYLMARHRNWKCEMTCAHLVFTLLGQLWAPRKQREPRMDSSGCRATHFIASTSSSGGSARTVYDSGSQSVVLGPEASTSPGIMLELQIFWCQPRPMKRKPRGWAWLCVLSSPPGDLNATQVWEPFGVLWGALKPRGQKVNNTCGLTCTEVNERLRQRSKLLQYHLQRFPSIGTETKHITFF